MAIERITARTNQKLYTKWVRIRRVCFSVNFNDYRCYGGLGISICPEWNNYENFYYWALDNGYSDKLYLTRKDKTKDFSPDNCNWGDLKEINTNRLCDRYITCPKTGKKQTVTDWAEELQIPRSTLTSRIKKMSIEKALTPGHLNKKTGKGSGLKFRWSTMKSRSNANANNFHYKGVTICDSWLFYSNFEKWAYDNGYQEHLLLGRKDTLKGFCPENCYWATWDEINRNKKDSIKIYYDGEVLCQKEVARKLGIRASNFHIRLNSDITTSEKLFCKGSQQIHS